MADCSGQHVLVTWDVQRVTHTGTTKSHPNCPNPTGNAQCKLDAKAAAWATANRTSISTCPDGCDEDPMVWVNAGNRPAIPLSVVWSETHTFPIGDPPAEQEGTCTYTANGTASIDKNRGTAECWPKELKVAMYNFPGNELMLISKVRESFTEVEISGVAEVLGLEI